jgi:hypothetical protein
MHLLGLLKMMRERSPCISPRNLEWAIYWDTTLLTLSVSEGYQPTYNTNQNQCDPNA